MQSVKMVSQSGQIKGLQRGIINVVPGTISGLFYQSFKCPLHPRCVLEAMAYIFLFRIAANTM
jgi:hypothetical protein